jgi:hypothetical protein
MIVFTFIIINYRRITFSKKSIFTDNNITINNLNIFLKKIKGIISKIIINFSFFKNIFLVFQFFSISIKTHINNNNNNNNNNVSMPAL